MQRLLKDAQKITGIKYDISNLNDVFQAIHVIQQQLDITGTTAKEAEETISGSVSSMKAAWDNFLNGSGTFDEFVDAAKIAFKNIASAAAELLPRIASEIANTLPEEFVTAVKVITPVLVTLGTALGIIWGYFKMVSVIKAVQKAFSTLNAIIAANPILLLVAAIAGLIAGFVYLWNKCEAFRNFWIGLWNGIKNVVSKAIETVRKIINSVVSFIDDIEYNLIHFFEDLGEKIGGVFGEIVTEIGYILVGIWTLISNNFRIAKTFIKGIIDVIKAIFSGNFSEIGDIVRNVFENIKAIIINSIINFTSILDSIIIIIKKIFSPIIDWFSNKFNEIKNAIVKVFSTIVQWLNKNVIKPIQKFFSPFVDWFYKLFKSIFDCLVSIVAVIIGLIKGCIQTIQIIWGMIVEWFSTNIIQPIQQFFISLWNIISSAAQTAWNFIVGVWTVVADWFNTNIIQPITQFFINLWNTVSSAAQSAWNGIVDIWNTVTQWFKDTIITPVSDFFDTMWNKLTNGASSAWQGIKNVFSSITNWFRDKFSEAWNAVKNVFSTGGKIFDGIKEGITATFKTVVNGIISAINKVIKVPFDGINGALDKIRNVGIGDAKPFSGLPRISTPQIPQLARGIGLAKKGHQYLLEGQGNEAVIPLDQNKYWTKAVATEMLKAINEQRSIASNNVALKSSVENRTILIDNHIEGIVELEGQKTGRLIAPHVMKTVKVGG